MGLPPIRNLDAIPVEHEGQTLIALRDIEGFVEGQLLLSPAAFFVATCLDGESDVLDIQYAFSKQFDGQTPSEEDIRRIVDMLDQNGFLDSERFAEIRDDIINQFGASDTRPAWLAGKSYPADPGELREYLDDFFVGDDKPGKGLAKGGAPLRALVVPHIDLDRGGHVYAKGYARLAQHGRPNTVLVFGVAHNGGTVPFILTRKHFETPLGIVETDCALVDQLAASCSWDPFEHEILHRTEHSIEFQALMLAFLYGTGVRIVPVLCGMMPEEPWSVENGDGVVAFLEACRAITADPEKRVSVIAGADLAHVGRRFGHDLDIDDNVVKAVEARDREDLAHVLSLAPEKFFGAILEDGNARQVCGAGAIYATLKSVEGSTAPGELLEYSYAPDPAGGIVSFAGIALPPKE